MMNNPQDWYLECYYGFDVIFCDLMMPEVTGMDFYAELKEVAPKQADAVVFVTGGAFTQRARAFLEHVPNPRLDKPFDGRQIKEFLASLPVGEHAVH